MWGRRFTSDYHVPINEDGSSLQTIMYPNGERKYNQKWSERAELVYGHSGSWEENS